MAQGSVNRARALLESDDMGDRDTALGLLGALADLFLRLKRLQG